MTAPERAPVVVSAAAVASAFNEAVIENAGPQLETLADPVRRAAFLAGLPAALDAINSEAADIGDGVLFAPGHALASRLLSAVADMPPEEATLVALTAGGLEVKFATNDWWGWFKSVFDHVSRSKAHPIVRPAGFEPLAIPDPCRIGIVGDWGTGLYGAPAIAESLRRLGPFDALLHLGDVYYSGTPKEVDERFLRGWPFDAAALHRALNSNHEMYAGGDAYFQKTLPRFGQESSYFALANEHWLLLGIDSAYVDHDLDTEQVEWIAEMIRRRGSRRVLLFSHHQLVSRFSPQGRKLALRLGAILGTGQVAGWYWAHEHRAVLYDADPRFGGILTRCLGHGGVPERRSRFADLPIERSAGGVTWRRFGGVEGAPGGLVLDGENPYIEGSEDDYAPHGFGVLSLSGPHLGESVHLPDGTVVHQAEPF